jgi:hypothetical protein
MGGSYDISTYNPYTGHVDRIPVSLSPPLRFNAMIRALPQNGLILVLGGLKAVRLKDDAKDQSRKGELHIIHRVDVFNVRTRQWERCDPLTLDGPLLEQSPAPAAAAGAGAQAIVDAVVVHSDTRSNESLLVLGPTNLFTNTRQCRMLSVADRKWLPQAEIKATPYFATLATHKSHPDRLFSFGGVSSVRTEIDERLDIFASSGPSAQFTALPLPSPQQHFDRQLSVLVNNTTTPDSKSTSELGWSTLDRLPEMKLARFQPTVYSVDGGFVVAGGEVNAEGETQFTVANVESYNFTTNKWIKLPDLPCLLSKRQKQHDASAVIVDCTHPQFVTLYNTIHYAPFGFCLPYDQNSPCHILFSAMLSL